MCLTKMTKIIERATEEQLSPYDQTGLMVKFYNNYMASSANSFYTKDTELIDMNLVNEKDASQFIAIIKAIQNNSMPGLTTPWKELSKAYGNIPEEIRGTWFSYGIQNQKWDDVRKSIWN